MAAVEILNSADGNLRAHGRYVKRSLGDGMYDMVLAFTLRAKYNGKFKLIGGGYSREFAVEFIKGEQGNGFKSAR